MGPAFDRRAYMRRNVSSMMSLYAYFSLGMTVLVV
jgi:hypothetical protein